MYAVFTYTGLTFSSLPFALVKVGSCRLVQEQKYAHRLEKAMGHFLLSLSTKAPQRPACLSAWPRQTAGPQDRWRKPTESGGAVLLPLHQQQMSHTSVLLVAHSQQAATPLLRLPGPAVPSGPLILLTSVSQSSFAWIAPNKLQE